MIFLDEVDGLLDDKGSEMIDLQKISRLNSWRLGPGIEKRVLMFRS